LAKVFRVRGNRPLPQAKRLRGPGGDELDALDLKEAPPAAAPDAHLDVPRWLKLLPRQERELLERHFLQGQSAEEIAAARGCSGAWVGSRCGGPWPGSGDTWSARGGARSEPAIGAGVQEWPFAQQPSHHDPSS
jgi:hypothetical protein